MLLFAEELYEGSLKNTCHNILVKQLDASHEPLDAHKKYGNNFSLARLLKLEDLEQTTLYRGSLIGCKGINKQKKKLKDFAELLNQLPGAKESKFHVFNFGPKIPTGYSRSSPSQAIQNSPHLSYRICRDGEKLAIYCQRQLGYPYSVFALMFVHKFS